MTLEEILEVIREEDFNVTLTGGDPLMHPESTAILSEAIKNLGYNIWLYTGYTIRQIRLSPALRKAVANIDTIVDAPFRIDLRDTDLLFRGSSNQRIINLQQ